MSKTLFILCFWYQLAVVIYGDMKYPLFTWKTVPTYIHMCNESGPFNEATNKRLATYPLVTIEKGQGYQSNGSLPLNYSSQYEESKIIEACKAIKQINESVICIMYLNSILDFQNYYLHDLMVWNPKYRLRDDNGVIVYEKGGTGLIYPMPDPKGYWVFDYQQKAVQNLFVSECINATKTGYVDGCFLDQSSRNNFDGYTFSQATINKFILGHNNVLYEIQKQLNDSGKSICIDGNDVNHVNKTAVSAEALEFFKANTDQLNNLIKLGNMGIIVEAHVYAESYNNCTNIINSLACFLIGARKFSYYACSSGWKIGGWLDHKEYHKVLGEPVGNAVLKGNEWTRQFKGNGKTMTTVQWNTKTLIGEIHWSDGTVQIGQNGSVV
eukprot:70454_1